MWREIDWQMISFVAATIVQEHWFHSFYLPKIYYIEAKK